jgi:hypothetical protein
MHELLHVHMTLRMCIPVSHLLIPSGIGTGIRLSTFEILPGRTASFHGTQAMETNMLSTFTCPVNIHWPQVL